MVILIKPFPAFNIALTQSPYQKVTTFNCLICNYNNKNPIQNMYLQAKKKILCSLYLAQAQILDL